MSLCPVRGLVDEHFAGTISEKDEHALRSHVLECAACREYYARHQLLSRLDPTAMRPEVRIGRALGVGQSAQVWRRAAPLPAMVAMAACVLLWLRPPSAPDGFASRGGDVVAAASRVLVYQAGGGRSPVRAGSSIGAHEELAFAYENGAGKHRLMIFGTDEHAHVYWFYPEWARPEDNPVAVPIAADGARHELSEAVTHHFDGRQLLVRALFVDGAVSVQEVEALLRAHPSGPLPIAGAIESATSFTVDP